MSFFSFNRKQAAILVVNSDYNPKPGYWLEICLKNVTAHTHGHDHRIYIWNNAVKDPQIPVIVHRYPHTQLIQAVPGEKLAHGHAVPLQRLYEIARKDNVKYIVALDSDAFPIQDGWLHRLIGALTEETVLAGVWRDELKHAIQPYVNASCLCTSVDFIDRQKLRFDFVDLSPDKKIDTLSTFTRAAEAGGYKIYKLGRTNKNRLHYLMAGIYGDLIYHHAAGSRKTVTFWGEGRSEDIVRENGRLREGLDRLIFNHPESFIRWLRGHDPFDPDEDPAFFTLLHQVQEDRPL